MKTTLKALVLVLSAIGISLPAFAEIYAVHSDHLGTPIRLTDSDKRIVWSATNRGYGEGIYNSDPDGDGRKVDMPLRYPGQYYDKESGLHYNYFRYYDPTVGRYITSDPIGLAGGINTYGYAGGDAVNNVDPLGLFYGGAYPNPAMYSLYGVDGTTGYVNDLNMSGALGGLMGFGGVAGFACYGSGACSALMALGLGAADNAGLIDAPMCSITKKPALPDNYWIKKQAPDQVTPGIRTTVDPYKPSSAGGTYHSTTHYDEFGRRIGQTHHTDHGRPIDHPNPHHHRRDPATGERLKTQDGSRTWPGLFGN